LVPTKEPQEPTTVTPAQITYHRRVQVLDRAGQTSVTEACRTFGISRTTHYRWAGRAQRHGLAALLPKGRRPPVRPTATPPDQVEAVLAEAVAHPTIGARRLVDHLADRGVRLSASGVQKILRRHRLGRRAQRVAALADALARHAHGLTLDPAKLTVNRYLDRWLAHVRTSLRARTVARYAALLRDHVRPAPGARPLKQLTPLEVQTLYDRLAVGGRKDHKPGGLAPQHILAVHRCLHRALAQAVTWRLLAANPATHRHGPPHGGGPGP
jgi:transposase